MPTAAQLDGMGRAALALVSGVAIMYGLGDAATWAIVTGAVMTLVAAGWSIFSNSQAELIKVVAKDEQVTEISVESRDLADSIPSEKVVQATP